MTVVLADCPPEGASPSLGVALAAASPPLGGAVVAALPSHGGVSASTAVGGAWGPALPALVVAFIAARPPHGGAMVSAPTAESGALVAACPPVAGSFSVVGTSPVSSSNEPNWVRSKDCDNESLAGLSCNEGGRCLLLDGDK